MSHIANACWVHKAYHLTAFYQCSAFLIYEEKRLQKRHDESLTYKNVIARKMLLMT